MKEDLLVWTSRAYASRSVERYSSGSRASTTWTHHTEERDVKDPKVGDGEEIVSLCPRLV